MPAGEPLAGMAHHKLHDLVWSGVPTMVPTEVDNDSKTNGRYAMPPPTAATLIWRRRQRSAPASGKRSTPCVR
ncbi:MAG: hypothetical protein U0528_05340 [Anaerolineae bacterium]